MSGQPVECRNCGSVSVSKPKGNGWITIILLFFLAVPAIIYEIWRRTGLGVCRVCGSQAIYPTDKPVDSASLAKGMMGRVIFMVFGVLASFFAGLFVISKTYTLYAEHKNKPQKSAFEQNKVLMIGALDSLSSQDKSPDEIAKILNGVTVDGCLRSVKGQMLSAIKLRKESIQIKQLQTSNDSVSAVIVLTNQIGQHIRTSQDLLSGCEYKPV